MCCSVERERLILGGAAAVGLLAMPEPRALDYFNGGRALQRMWLTATEHEIAVHPMTTLYAEL